jgi:hypothetical protein
MIDGRLFHDATQTKLDMLSAVHFIAHTATSLDALKGLETSTKYVYRFDTKNSITLMCKKGEN